MLVDDTKLRRIKEDSHVSSYMRPCDLSISISPLLESMEPEGFRNHTNFKSLIEMIVRRDSSVKRPECEVANYSLFYQRDSIRFHKHWIHLAKRKIVPLELSFPAFLRLDRPPLSGVDFYFTVISSLRETRIVDVNIFPLNCLIFHLEHHFRFLYFRQFSRFLIVFFNPFFAFTFLYYLSLFYYCLSKHIFLTKHFFSFLFCNTLANFSVMKN